MKDPLVGIYLSKSNPKTNNIEPFLKVVLSNAERKTVEQLNHDHEEQRELAATRLAELESTNSKFKESLKEVEKLKMYSVAQRLE